MFVQRFDLDLILCGKMIIIIFYFELNTINFWKEFMPKKDINTFLLFLEKKRGKGVTSSEFLGFTLILSQLLNCREESLLHKTLLGKARLASMLSGSIGDIMNWVLTFRH